MAAADRHSRYSDEAWSAYRAAGRKRLVTVLWTLAGIGFGFATRPDFHFQHRLFFDLIEVALFAGWLFSAVGHLRAATVATRKLRADRDFSRYRFRPPA